MSPTDTILYQWTCPNSLTVNAAMSTISVNSIAVQPTEPSRVGRWRRLRPDLDE